MYANSVAIDRGAILPEAFRFTCANIGSFKVVNFSRRPVSETNVSIRTFLSP